jgi:hypothetical protein
MLCVLPVILRYCDKYPFPPFSNPRLLGARKASKILGVLISSLFGFPAEYGHCS